MSKNFFTHPNPLPNGANIGEGAWRKALFGNKITANYSLLLITYYLLLLYQRNASPQRKPFPHIIRIINHPHINAGGSIFAIPALGRVGGFKNALAPTVVDDHAEPAKAVIIGYGAKGVVEAIAVGGEGIMSRLYSLHFLH